MRVFAIPTATSGFNAAFSIVFFTGLNRLLGDTEFGRIIMLQAIAAVVLMLVQPQGFAYLIGARNLGERVSRYREAATIEGVGVTVGLVMLAVAGPLAAGADSGWTLVFLYLSLAVQGLGSCNGWLRASEAWKRYVVWQLMANVVRATAIWFVIATNASGTSLSVSTAALAFFLLPDFARFAAIAVPLAVKHYRPPPRAAFRPAMAAITANWLYDLGSQATDVIDRIVVGAVFGPMTLATYFFARRMASFAQFVTEPYFAEHYRRLVAIDSASYGRAVAAVAFKGVVIALTIAAAIMVVVWLILGFEPLAHFVPSAVSGALGLFALIMLIDCLRGANRWNRYVAIMVGKAWQLLAARLAIFALFAALLWLAGRGNTEILVIAFALSWLLELLVNALYLGHRARIGPEPKL